MDGIEKIIVITGPYKFQIIDNTLFSRDKTEIYSRSFKIGGTYSDGVTISVLYENNKPVDARISFIRPSEKGDKTIIMIKTLLNYVYTQLPMLTHITFDDISNIECAPEEEANVSTPLTVVSGVPSLHIPLYYFSILFNGQTWYENYFNAKQKDEVRHQQYRTRVNEFLYSREFKTNIWFDRFVSLFDKKEEEMTELYQYYNNANNFNDFFQSMPKQHRCRLVGSWIEQLMKFILKDVFYNENWVIHFPLEMSAGNNNVPKYYCPKGIIANNFKSPNICISPEDL